MRDFLSLGTTVSLIFLMDHFLTNFLLNPWPWLIYIKGREVNSK